MAVRSMIRWIVLASYPYQGMDLVEHEGSEQDPLPSFASHEAALTWATEQGLRSRKGFRDFAEVLAVET